MDNNVGRKYRSIEFTKFTFYQDDTGFECTVKADDHKNPDIIYFKFNKPIGKISNNLVFGALMTLVGKDWYESVSFDLSVSKQVYERATKLTSSKIGVRDLDYDEDEGKRSDYDGVALSLSGGIDSNALYYLMKRGEVPFHAIGTDFGPTFARDTDVFRGRVELIMTTNIRDEATKYVSDVKTWQFMGISAILSTDYFKTKNILFGQVNQFDRYMRTLTGDGNRIVKFPSSDFLSIADCNMHGIKFLTEFQNAVVVLDNVKDKKVIQKIEDASATTHHRGKFFRKQMFLLAARKYLGMPTTPCSKFKFIDPADKFHKRFVEEVNSVTMEDKNLVLVLGLKYMGYTSPEFKNKLFSRVRDFTFIEDVCMCDIPEFYRQYPALMDYLSTLFTMRK